MRILDQGNMLYTAIMLCGNLETKSPSIPIQIDENVSAGVGDIISVCINTSLDLFTGLSGFDPGGTWYDDNGSGVSEWCRWRAGRRRDASLRSA